MTEQLTIEPRDYHSTVIDRNIYVLPDGMRGGRPAYKYVQRPAIVCLCGSTRFKEAFDEANYRETMAGKIVLSVGFYMHASGNRHGDGVGCDDEQKKALDVLHFRKIELADEVLILNVNGYVGTSTLNELRHATTLGKTVRWLEPQNAFDPSAPR